MIPACLKYYRCQRDRLKCSDDEKRNPKMADDVRVGLLIREERELSEARMVP
jgi:hypothetical protein